MFWTLLFAVSAAQGIFLVLLIVAKGFKNSLSSRLISAMIFIMILTNLGYLVVRTDLWNYVPQLFAVPFGMMYLFGPLFYFYSRSVTDSSFRWKTVYWLHFLPYVVQLGLNFQLFFFDRQTWDSFRNLFFNNQLQLRTPEKINFCLQIVQLSIYILQTLKWTRKVHAASNNTQFVISISARINWLRSLMVGFILFLLTVTGAYVFLLYTGTYYPPTNYLYTLVTSGIIYFIAYKLVLYPELISPDFAQKYRAYMQFSGDDGEKYLTKLKGLMTERKLFTNPDLKLAMLAEEMGLPSHQLSKLINEKFGKSFTDFINEYRVQEFLKLINNEQNSSFTLLGLAMDVGFNSKSSFNLAFKKITGKTPSEFKTAS